MSKPQTTESTSKTPIFAYLRRSTTKVEQEESLPQQYEGIEHIAKELWFDMEKIEKFIESKSGFENRTRPKWKEMLMAIDKSKEPCIILTRDTSRLSRNPTDNLEIANRIFWDNGYKKKIWKIYFIGEKFEVIEWNEKTNKKHIVDTLHSNYTNSLETKDKSMTGIILKLQAGNFPYAAPKWLDAFVPQKKQRILKQNEKMPFVLRAFEMKTEGKTHMEISKYLRQYGNIKLSDRELTERLFKNTVYIGEYTEKTTKRHFTKLLFAEWKPPIPFELWDKVQKCLGRKISQYGEKQEWDVIAEKLRTEDGKRMSKYLAKKKYVNYKNTIENINITEKEILKFFSSEIGRMLVALTEKQHELFKPVEPEGRSLKRLGQYEKAFYQKIGDVFVEKDWKVIKKKGERLTPEKLKRIHLLVALEKFHPNDWEFYDIDEDPNTLLVKPISEEGANILSRNSAYMELARFTKERFTWMNKHLEVVKKENIANLQKQKEQLEEEKKNYRRKALNMDFSKEEIDETTKDIEKSINRIEKEINELSENSDMEQYLERLPLVLSKTFELASKAIPRAEDDGMKGDLLKLLEITTVELTFNNKKELKVKLFDVLDRLLSDDYSVLEAPPGVEPGYGALQAPA